MERGDFRYWAFISYSGKDARWARWLHRAIENYGVPVQLISRTTPTGEPTPKRLRPVFRDRDELAASSDLGRSIEEALRDSRYLIVICSPRAAVSRWVNQEIERFRALGRTGRVLGLIVDGEPNSGDDRECYPPALRDFEPLAADARPIGDGKHDALLKLLAGMLGLGLDDLKRRDAQQRARRLQWALAVSLTLVAAFAGLAWYSNMQRLAAIFAQSEETKAKLAAVKAKDEETIAKNAAIAAKNEETKAKEAAVQAKNEETKAKNAALIAQADAEAEAEYSKRSDYANRIALAEIEIGRGNIARARTLLDDCLEEMRHFEWRRLRAIMDVSVATLTGHERPVRFIGADLAGERFVSLSDDHVVRVWDSKQGTDPIFTLRGQKYTHAALAGDGKRLVAGGQDGLVRVFDVGEDARALHTLRGHQGAILDVTISADGERIASIAGDGKVFVWDADEGGKPLLKISAHHPLALSSDGKRLATTDGQAYGSLRINVYDLDAAAEHKEPPPAAPPPNGFAPGAGPREGPQPQWILRGHQGNVTALNFIADNTGIVSASSDGTAKIWDLKEKEVAARQTLQGKGHIFDAAASADGQWIATKGNSRFIHVWNIAHGGEPIVLRGHEGGVTSLAMSADGQRILSGGGRGDIKIWNRKLGDAATRSILGDQRQHTPIAVTADGKRIVAGRWDNSVKVWDADEGGDPVLTLDGHTREVISVAVTGDGRRIVSGSYDNTIKIWDGERGGPAVRTLTGHTGAVNALALSADGKRVVSAGSFDHTLKVWDADQGGKPVFNLSRAQNFTSVAVSPDGKRIVAGNMDHTVTIWEPDRDARDVVTLRGHQSDVFAVALSPDGERVASGGRDLTIRIYDADQGGEAVLVLTGHGSTINALAYSADGKRLISGGEDNLIKIWNAEQGGEALLTLEGQDSAIRSVALNEAGTRLVASSFFERIKIWDGVTGDE